MEKKVAFYLVVDAEYLVVFLKKHIKVLNVQMQKSRQFESIQVDCNMSSKLMV